MTTTVLSDGLLERDVRAALTAHGLGVSDLNVVCIDGRIRLCGAAPSYMQKRHAESVAAAVPGVRQVVNQLRVVPL